MSAKLDRLSTDQVCACITGHFGSGERGDAFVPRITEAIGRAMLRVVPAAALRHLSPPARMAAE
jgi:hypothetical protein